MDEVNQYFTDKAVNETTLTDEQINEIARMLEMAKLPIKITDDDFQMGEGEVDIRSLSRKNKDQMLFRMGSILPNVYLKQILTTLIDIERLLMLTLDKLGVDNISKDLDTLIQKLAEQNPLN